MKFTIRFIKSNIYKLSKKIGKTEVMGFIFFKRLIDILVSCAGIVFSAPLWLLISVLILIEDGLPVFYCQKRMGKSRKVFKLVKFRSMMKGADKKGIWTNDNDPRITKIGRILRRTAMDELPSLISILKGDMSIVGPKPLAIEEQIKLENEIPGYEKRLQVRPGLTGMSQVFNLEDDSYKKLEYDLEYIEKMNFWLDIKLIIFSFYNTLMFRWDKRSGKIKQKV